MEFLYQALEKLVFGHPIHPPSAHMPTGLLVAAFIFLLISLVPKYIDYQTTARRCLMMAAIFFLPTVFLGITDWMHYYAGIRSYYITMKIILSVVLALFLLVTVILEIKGGPLIAKIGMYFLCVAAVVGIGYFGGALVFPDKSAIASAADADVKKGAELYAVNCASCHPDGGNVINPKYPVKGSILMKDSGSFTQFNRNPVKTDGSESMMPAFSKEKLSDQEMKQIYQYINTVLAGQKAS
ncbi:MAG: Cytochrome c6 [Syntrophus sp. SKADARSKE-3]|nr:Cytochrome c6 [Syntrophus sp. SKADARSKE-3]